MPGIFVAGIEEAGFKKELTTPNYRLCQSLF